MDKYLFIFDGAYAYSPQRFKAYEAYTRLGKKIPASVQQSLQQEKQQRSYTPLLDLIYHSPLIENHSANYYPQFTILPALARIKKLATSNKTCEFTLAGYSWGGAAAMRLARALERDGIKVHKIFLLDPVLRGFLALGVFKSLKGDSKFFKKPSNVSHLFNVYQKSDHWALPFISIRGNKVIGADYNFNLSTKYPHAGHCNLHEFSEVKQLFSL